MTSQWQPYREPIRATLVRTVGIAVVVGALLAQRLGGWSRWPVASLMVLWPSFGGHWVEIFFLNWLRPRLPAKRPVQIAARLTTWFLAGTLITRCMGLTAWALAGYKPSRWPSWWLGGLAFIGVELIAHVPLQLRGRPGFYDGRG